MHSKQNFMFRMALAAILFTAGLAATPVAPAAVTPIFTNHFSQNPQPYSVPVTGYPDGTGARFGQVLAAVGNGRFAVSAPQMDVLRSQAFAQGFVTDAGFVWTYNQSNVFTGSASAPLNNLRRWYGVSMSAFPDGRFLVGTGSSSSPAAGVTNSFAGSVHLHDPNGALLATWTNPESPNDAFGFFGSQVAALPGNRFAVSTAHLFTGVGKVFVYDAAVGDTPLVVIPNPTPDPSGESFGQALAALGSNRLLIGDKGDKGVAGKSGSVMVYDLSGNLLNTIPNPTTQNPFTESELLGAALLAVDDNRFLASAPFARVRHTAGGQVTTNNSAGAVYLFDGTGAVLSTFVAPDVARSQFFGTSLALFGSGHVLIGCESERINGVAAGSVHLFTLGGVHLATVDNPTPAFNDQFGHAIAVLDDRRFVVGAPGDDTLRADAGSIYGYEVAAALLSPPILTGSVALEIEPPEAVADGAQWALAGGSFQPSGVPLAGVLPGRYSAQFNDLANWRAPPQTEIFVVGGQATTATAVFTPLPTFDYREIPEQHVRHGETVKFFINGTGPGVLLQVAGVPPPQGVLTFDPATGRFAYTPAAADRMPFTLTFSIGGTPVATTTITPFPNLPPEDTLITYNRPLPDPESRNYINISEIRHPAELFNDATNETFSVSISGKTLVFGATHPANLHQQYSGRQNLKELHLFADRVIIRSPLLLPQTRVSIHARELRFEGDGQINTTPRARMLAPPGADADNNLFTGHDGDPGHPAGDVDVLVERFHADPVPAIRFVLQGGMGGPAGQGRNGRFEGDGNFSPGSSEWTNLMSRAGNVICGVDNGGILYRENVTIFGGTATTNVVCGSQVPARGEPAVPSGVPGVGGRGGTLRSTVNLASFASLPGGNPGAQGGNYVGGELFFPYFYRAFVTRTVGGQTDFFNSDTPAPKVPGASAPAPAGANGAAGGLVLAEPADWLHSFSVRSVVQYAKDAYLNGHDADTRALLAEYREIIRSLQPPVVSVTNLSEQAFAESTGLDQVGLELETLIHRIDSNLDFFGNPGGWVPMLSFEANLVAFEREVNQSIPILYLAYWLNQAATNQQNTLAASQVAVGKLRTELDDMVSGYNQAQLLIPQLKVEADAIRGRIAGMQANLLVLEFELVQRAEQNVAERHKVPAWKQALRTLSVVADLVPVGQPTVGRIGGGLGLLAGLDPEKPLASASANLTNVFALFSEKNIEVCFSSGSTNSPGTNSAAAKKEDLKRMTECAKFLGAELKELAGVFKKAQVDSKEVAAELEKIKASDPAFREVTASLAQLNLDKERFAEKLAEALQAVSKLTSGMAENVLATAHLEERVANALATLDHNALLHIKELEQRAKDRLLRFQYFVAKSFQYRVLQPYSGNLQLNRLFDRFRVLVEGDGNHVLSEGEFTNLKTIYLAELRDTVAQTLQILNANAPERSLPIQFQLTAQELQQLNTSGQLILNLRKRGLFPSSHENIRIAELRTHALTAHPVGGSVGSFALAFLDFEHLGLSRLTTGGQSFLFRHYQAGTVNPITWNTVFDAVANGFSNSTLSPTAQSLLSILLAQPTTGNLLLFSRPAADADILLRKEVQTDNGVELVLDSLVVQLEYDFSATGASRSRLEVVVTEDLEPVITLSQSDLNGRRDGKGDFRRVFPTGAVVTLQSPASYGARAFERWVVNGQGRPVGETTLTLALTTSATAEARFAIALPPGPGPDIEPPAIITSVPAGSESLGFQYPTVSGLLYTLEETTQLEDPIWTAVDFLMGDGSPQSFQRPISTNPASYFRLRVNNP